MARISDAEIERLKAEVSLVRLIESAGVKLTRKGKDELLGCCPFHEDGTPSLSVSVAKNLFHCFGCHAAGGVIDWVMKQQGVSFRHAVELLRDGAALDAPSSSPIRATVRKLAAPVAFDADDAALLAQVTGYYHETLKNSAEGLEYLRSRGLDHPELLARFRLGLADRTLGLRLPEKNRKAGADIRARLERIGIYRASGHEHLTGSLVVPVVDAAGHVSEVYGRKIRNNLRAGTPMHLYLPGPHRGVWNLDGIAASGGEVILAEALIDAMTFWCAGYRNVTAAYGAGGLTDDHLAAFKAHSVTRVLIAFDRDPAGDTGAAEVAARLMAEGIACYRIQFPKGMDANAYALSVKPAAKSLGVLIRKAEWLGNGRAPAITSGHDELTAALGAGSEDRAEPSPPSPLAAEPKATVGQSDLATSAVPEPESEPLPEPAIATPLPEAPTPDAAEVKNDQELVLTQGDRRYRVRGRKVSSAQDRQQHRGLALQVRSLPTKLAPMLPKLRRGCGTQQICSGFGPKSAMVVRGITSSSTEDLRTSEITIMATRGLRWVSHLTSCFSKLVGRSRPQVPPNLTGGRLGRLAYLVVLRLTVTTHMTKT